MTITITHLEGPLKGTEQTFGDDVPSVVFGRDREAARVVYPPQYDVVGRLHFELRRTKSGDYAVELFGTRYVEINGIPAENGMPVKSGSTFRLGRKDGPAFKVEIGAPSAKGLLITGDQSEMTTGYSRLLRYGTYAGGAFAAVLVGFFAYTTYLHSTLGHQIEAARAEASEIAKTEFSPAVLKTLEAAVYLVAKKHGNVDEAAGTAFAFAPGKLATNAHVTEAIKKGYESEYFLVTPNGDKVDIEGVVSHPGYTAFENYKRTQGTIQWDEFVALDLVNEYDVGIIEVDPKIEFRALLEFASQEELEQLAPGTPVASFGFPVEGLAGDQTASKAPGKLRFGYISALTDVFMIRAEPEHRLLIQHSVPVTGGASGSPLIDPSGKVIGIVNGGNTTVFKDKTESLGAKVRVPNAALINFAQRADLLTSLADGDADSALTEEEAYWDEVAEQFDGYFDVALETFRKDAKDRYGVSEGKETALDSETLKPGSTDTPKLVTKTYTIEASPGLVYGFIADTKSGIPLGINVKKKGTKEYVRDAKDPRKTTEPEPAPTAWVTVTEPTTLEVVVWGFLTEPARFQLHTYAWDATPGPSAGAGF
ncbi:MAG: trypsin-like peptidase domain-containing protein [Methyloceanibacter sp.]|uniref:trypsin-like peptidase domain-containing protein n=1 Tax=Methyloceanibacter sp. TaxID=1965321 RepID=UPI003D6C89BD